MHSYVKYFLSMVVNPQRRENTRVHYAIRKYRLRIQDIFMKHKTSETKVILIAIIRQLIAIILNSALNKSYPSSKK